jgi:predicted lipoprotein with Yx(FWY)xxD motif
MRKTTFAAFAATLLLVATACGDAPATTPSQEPGEATSTATASGSPSVIVPDLPTPTAVSIKVADTGFGSILTDGMDRTLYVFLLDDGRDLACVADCLAAWSPVMIDGAPDLEKGLSSDVFDTVKREGQPQLTIGGQPAYTFSGDAAGEINGQGLESLWFVVAPDGSRITTVSPSV